MKYIFSVCLLLAFVNSEAQTIKAADATNYIGKSVTICDTVTSVFTSLKNDKAPTMLDIGGDYPNNPFTAVVFKDEASKFSYQLYTLKGKAVCITGIVKSYKGKPEIIVDDEKQIVIK